MKKEYHLTISRRDRIYLTAFVLFLLGWELIKPVLPFFIKNDFLENQAVFPIDTSHQKKDSVSNSASFSKKQTYPFVKKYANQEIADDTDMLNTPAPLHILEATPPELMAIGFSKKTAYIIRKYIDAGGIIYDEKGLMRIFSMDSAQLQATAPYIIFPPARAESKATTNYDDSEPILIAMDLNKATAMELESLPGIGPVLADRIIKFRTALGGFIKPEQLLECYGLTPETFEKIKPQLKVTATPTFININQIDPKTFSHPYLEKKMLWMIESYKKNHGPIENEEELRNVFPPDPNWCDRLIPYVKFDLPISTD